MEGSDAGAGAEGTPGAGPGDQPPLTEAGRAWWERRGGHGAHMAPNPALEQYLAQRGFPQVDPWRMTPVHHLSPEQRHGFDEVAQGYLSDEEVRAEAARCVLCKHPTCISGCPNNNPIPTFLALVVEGRILDAAVADYEKNSLAACTGRVCNWEEQCEGWCVLNADGEGVRIGAIERYIADYALRHRQEFEELRAQRAQERMASGASSYTRPDVSTYAAVIEAYGGAFVPGYGDPHAHTRWLAGAEVPGYGPEDAPPHDQRLDGRRVAIVGSGPAGLACADFLSQRGASVTVFEAMGYPGGLLADGIPAFVLPQEVVDAEIARIADQGVAFRYGQVLGENLHLDSLRQEYEAVFVGVGAEVARRLGVPGEDARGVVTAQAFLRQAKRSLIPGSGVARPAVGRRVVVIGAGNTAMDAARTSLRLGAAECHILYRRTRAESPSRDIEIQLATEEGVHFDYLVNPTAVVKDADGGVAGVELERMRLGARDASGRPRPEPIPGSRFTFPCDMVILAVGYSVHGADLAHPELLHPDGRVRTHGEGGATDLPGLFVGGDVVRGAFTVVHAIRDGRLAADAIGAYLLRTPGRT
jgi:NADPH-dependent glutamate synthase beta subunit-like oxidoreductase